MTVGIDFAYNSTCYGVHSGHRNTMDTSVLVFIVYVLVTIHISRNATVCLCIDVPGFSCVVGRMAVAKSNRV